MEGLRGPQAPLQQRPSIRWTPSHHPRPHLCDLDASQSCHEDGLCTHRLSAPIPLVAVLGRQRQRILPCKPRRGLVHHRRLILKIVKGPRGCRAPFRTGCHDQRINEGVPLETPSRLLRALHTACLMPRDWARCRLVSLVYAVGPFFSGTYAPSVVARYAVGEEADLVWGAVLPRAVFGNKREHRLLCPSRGTCTWLVSLSDPTTTRDDELGPGSWGHETTSHVSYWFDGARPNRLGLPYTGPSSCRCPESSTPC